MEISVAHRGRPGQCVGLTVAEAVEIHAPVGECFDVIRGVEREFELDEIKALEWIDLNRPFNV